MDEKNNGDCYLCGKNLSKTAMKNHILKSHNEEKDGKECYLLKIEGVADDNYWLYIDVPLDKSLSTVDSFLRKIWLECCGHLSEFNTKAYGKISSGKKLENFNAGEEFIHIYDFGTTTESTITVMGNIKRKPQKDIVRLLARNTPPVFTCAKCGKEADLVCGICLYESDNPFYCMKCSEEHKCGSDMFLPVTNSPRMGECGYTGELDDFFFDPAVLKTI
ncbi:MAG: hypothetical protein FWC03_10230 [Treponema sp.]|nr:hypothetical protein [Treponema sp.]